MIGIGLTGEGLGFVTFAAFPSSSNTLIEFKSQKASSNAFAFFVTYSSQVGASAAHSGVCDQS